MRAEELDDSLLVLQARHEHVEVHPVDPLDRELHMTADDLGNVLCYHPLGSGRAGFASRRHLGRSSVFETGLTRACHQPAIGATKSTRLVGLRRSLTSFLLEHDLRANASRLSRGKTGTHFSGSCSNGQAGGPSSITEVVA